MATKSKPRPVVSLRITEEALQSIGGKDKSKIAERAIEKMNGRCPLCRQSWPQDRLGKKPVTSLRIEKGTFKKIDKFENVSRFLAVALEMELGLCPLCHQPR